jgi:galactose mutarotase-like enzyme
MADGFRLFTISSELAELTVAPELGAKIVSLRNRGSGHEWMWRPQPTLRLFRNQPEAPFETGPLTGADECFPTVSPCYWQERRVPDHGELWTSGWELDEARLGQNVLRTSVRCPVAPFTLERQISLDRISRHQTEFVFEYRLTSRSGEPERFLWAFHPLFPVTKDTRLEIDPAPGSVLATAVSGIASVAAGGVYPWPSPVGETRLDRLDLGPGPAYVKLFAGVAGPGRASASITQGRERLSLDFDTSEIPFLAIWLTRGAWNGYTHFSIEPTNAACDSLDRVPVTDRTVVPPQGSIEWCFRIELESS